MGRSLLALGLLPFACGACEHPATCEHGVCLEGSCVCDGGYSGERCAVAPDPCTYPVTIHCSKEATCLGGKCVHPDHCDGVGCGPHGACSDGVCVCELGFTGPSCGVKDTCASAPCRHGGTCYTSFDVRDGDGVAHSQLQKAWADAGGHYCACGTGWDGAECQCPDCGPNGVCQPTGFCLCRPGFSGVRCDTNLDECASGPCENGGSCTDEMAAYTCNCHVGWTGLNCAEDVDECASLPCENGGSCTDGVGVYDCGCVAGFGGYHCEVNADECVSAPCMHGGTCIDGHAAFSCVCITGWAGAHCDEHICQSTRPPCANGALCAVDSTSAKGYRCECVDGWTGDNCLEPPNPCIFPTVVQCGAHGTCVAKPNHTGSASCKCRHGYKGAHCEKAPGPCYYPQLVVCGSHGYCSAGHCVCTNGYRGSICNLAPPPKPPVSTATTSSVVPPTQPIANAAAPRRLDDAGCDTTTCIVFVCDSAHKPVSLCIVVGNQQRRQNRLANRKSNDGRPHGLWQMRPASQGDLYLGAGSLLRPRSGVTKLGMMG